jgi:hypothetical protein
MPLESTISKNIQKAVRAKIPGTVILKRHVSMGVMGHPDLYGCLPGGRHFEIEVKQPGNAPTELQQERLAEWKAAGAITGVATTVAEALAILFQGMWDQLEDERRTR